jgi:hypothetical protein
MARPAEAEVLHSSANGAYSGSWRTIDLNELENGWHSFCKATHSLTRTVPEKVTERKLHTISRARQSALTGILDHLPKSSDWRYHFRRKCYQLTTACVLAIQACAVRSCLALLACKRRHF